MSQEQLTEFRELVLQTEELQAELWRTPDRAAFVALLVRLGAARGYDFTPAEVDAALRAGRREWAGQWV